ncbi:transposase [Oceanisphaera pacifica]|uniref:Transposase n=1 Tax=Oceanisphaera pacifica TaxID=2818389 RepID=A0ABS3NG39_9GAMM|nr:transposase [Oceanisphaera pacifica]MBO1519548.1 transposase [Oceanisphaera pacifica]
MAKPRVAQVSIQDTPFYHCVSRTVRRAFLCGVDEVSGRTFEHRRKWLEKRLLFLTQAFAIDITAYAVMSNHVHVVLRIDAETAMNWRDIDVVNQWHKLFKGTPLTQRFANGEVVKAYEIDTLNERVAEYRRRLIDISWFMRALSEPIARQANKEDNCTGRFWEGRFKSQALLDEAAVLACMTYVDLNPIRANMATTPETSKHTSIKRRIYAAKQGAQPKRLLPFVGNDRKELPKGLLFDVKDYITLVDDMGRILRDDKGGAIAESTANILNRLNISLENWLKITEEFKYLFTGPVGSLEDLTRYCKHLGMQRRAHLKSCQHWSS